MFFHSHCSSLYGNRLTGPIPAELAKITGLKHLWVSAYPYRLRICTISILYSYSLQVNFKWIGSLSSINFPGIFLQNLGILPTLNNCKLCILVAVKKHYIIFVCFFMASYWFHSVLLLKDQGYARRATTYIFS